MREPDAERSQPNSDLSHLHAPILEIDRFRGSLVGLAAGDAVGTTLEFTARGSFPDITDMTGGGPFQLKPGQWTDDTSMALCLAVSLLECGGFNPIDQMDRYCRWFREGYLSSTGECFDIGNTTVGSLHRFIETGDPFSGSTNPRTSGNGSIMRLTPVVLFFYPNLKATLHNAQESSRTTHGSVECVECCRLLAEVLFRALSGEGKRDVLFSGDSKRYSLDSVAALAEGSYRRKSRDQIVGSGRAVESLEAALWCFFNTENFEQAILMAANLGEDADTTAAVCGQIAGAYYGIRDIPEHWLERLSQREFITDLAERLYGAGREPGH